MFSFKHPILAVPRSLTPTFLLALHPSKLAMENLQLLWVIQEMGDRPWLYSITYPRVTWSPNQIWDHDLSIHYPNMDG
jgi:hypothetical protein